MTLLWRGHPVEVAGNKTESKVTDADGKVTFSGLKGTVEVLVEMGGLCRQERKVRVKQGLEHHNQPGNGGRDGCRWRLRGPYRRRG